VSESTEGRYFCQVCGDEYAKSASAAQLGFCSNNDCSGRVTEQSRVAHPAHYAGNDGKCEAIEVIEAHNLNFALGSAVKYILRAGRKPGAALSEDLRKAVWFIEREIERADD